MLLRPVDNPLKYTYNGYTIEFTNVHELVQGGPETGNLVINGFSFGNKMRFGTNILISDGFLIVPRYKSFWGFFKTGNFKLCLITLLNKKFIEFGDIENLIMPKEIIDDQLLYFTDLNNKNLVAVNLPKVFK